MTDNASAPDAVTIERTFDAPVELIWQMWTRPEHFAAWYGPAGATMPVVEMDVRIGGRRLVCMEVVTPAGPRQMWFTGEYREIVDHRRLVYTESMSNESGDILTPSDLGMPPDHPVTTEVRVDLDDLGGRTKMTMTHVGIAADSPGAIGWTVAVDKLADHLLKLQQT